MRVLVTGAGGFTGRYMLDFLSGNGSVELFGIMRERPAEKIKRKRVRYYSADMRSPSAVKRILRSVKPDRVFHLAGQSVVARSWEKPEETLEINVFGALNLFEALRALKLRSRVQIAGSAEEYGVVARRSGPPNENCALNPLSPYGVSKAVQDFSAMQYHLCFGLHIVRTRAYNYIGPGQRDDFVTSNFAKQIASIEAGKEPQVIRVGDLSAVRDFTDVRDMVRAYWLALEKADPGEVYNVCTGCGVTMQEVLDIYLKKSRVKIRIKKDPARMRPSGIPVMVGDPSKFMKRTGWKPVITLEKSLSDILDSWRTLC